MSCSTDSRCTYRVGGGGRGGGARWDLWGMWVVGSHEPSTVGSHEPSLHGGVPWGMCAVGEVRAVGSHGTPRWDPMGYVRGGYHCWEGVGRLKIIGLASTGSFGAIWRL